MHHLASKACLILYCIWSALFVLLLLQGLDALVFGLVIVVSGLVFHSPMATSRLKSDFYIATPDLVSDSPRAAPGPNSEFYVAIPGLVFDSPMATPDMLPDSDLLSTLASRMTCDIPVAHLTTLSDSALFSAIASCLESSAPVPTPSTLSNSALLPAISARLGSKVPPATHHSPRMSRKERLERLVSNHNELKIIGACAGITILLNYLNGGGFNLWLNRLAIRFMDELVIRLMDEFVGRIMGN